MTASIKLPKQAPDWRNHSFRERMYTCVTQLKVYGILSDKERDAAHRRLKKMFGDK